MAWKRRGVKLLLFVLLALLGLVFPFEGYITDSFRLLPSMPLSLREDGQDAPPGEADPSLPSRLGASSLSDEEPSWDAPASGASDSGEQIVWRVTTSKDGEDASSTLKVPTEAGGEKADKGALGSRAVREESGGKNGAEQPALAAVRAMAAWRSRQVELGHMTVHNGQYRSTTLEPGCAACCHAGERWGVPCLDVDECASKAPAGGKYAFVYAHVGRPGWPWLTFINSMRTQALALAAETNGTADVVVIMVAQDAKQLSSRHRQHLERYGARLVEVPWSIPPTLRWWPKHWWPGKADGWCGPQDLIRLHVLALEGYDAAAFYDQDIEFQGDAGAALKCAATGRFLSTSGGVGEPLNVGFFAVRPDPRLLKAALIFAENASFSEGTGWANSGFKPAGGYFVGAECGQGYFNTLFYHTKSAKARSALAAAGLLAPDGTLKVAAAQLDRCIWNYQTGFECPAGFDCERVRVHHKPTGKPVGKDCTKLARRKGPKLAFSPEPPAMARQWAHLGCEEQFVNIGANCKCEGENYIKQISVRGFVKACHEATVGGSGDTFRITFAGSTVTATRTDARSCWCDDSVEAYCCISSAAGSGGSMALGYVAGAAGATAAASKLDDRPQPRSAVKRKRSDAEQGKAAWKFQSPEVHRILAGWQSSAQRPRVRACQDCCHDGEKWGVPCFDVEACAAPTPSGGKYAFVYAQVGRPGWPWLTFLASMKRQAVALATKTGGTADIILLMPAADIKQMNDQHRNHLQKYNVRVLEVPWTIPPALRWWPSDWWPGKADGWCGPQDLMRLHVLGLDEYDAAAFYDQDVEFQGDATPVLLCASKGHFISASGGVGEPLNVGFFALRPDRRLLLAAEKFAEGVTFNRQTGWANSGFKPAGGYFIGAECGQGYFHTLFYHRNSAKARAALAEAGFPSLVEAPSGAVKAVVIDRCIWNYQTGIQCPRDMDCETVRVHHKPNGKPLGRDCSKLAFRVPPSTPALPASVNEEETALPCEVRKINIGPNCKCDQPNFVKTIDVPGLAVGCQPVAKNPSGDSFRITWARSTEGINFRLTATRDDADSCWCDNTLDVECCIISREVVSKARAPK